MSGGRAFLHVGSPKTGTTFLQSVLWRERERVREAGLLLPLGGVQAHFRATLDLREMPEHLPDPTLVPGAWQRLVDAAADWDGDVLVSHELLAAATPEQAARGVASFAEQRREVHVVITARDLARQLPAEWQERIKARADHTFGEWMERLHEPEGFTAAHLWAVQDIADVARRWGATLPPERVHVVTVPPAGAPRGLLWERFAGLLGLEPAAYSLDVVRANESLGAEQAELLRRLNVALGERLPRPGPYPGVVKGDYAHRVLSRRPGTKLVLAGDDLEFAREQALRIVTGLQELGVDVVGDLDELLVTEPPRPDEVSPGRVPVSEERLAAEAVEGTIGLLEVLVERRVAHQDALKALREELAGVRRRVREVEAERDTLQARTAIQLSDSARAVRRRAGAASRRLRRGLAGGLGAWRRGRRQRVVFLMMNADGVGGVARTTINVANGLAETHDVEILSVYRRRGRTTFPLDPRVRLTYLVPTNPRSPKFRDEESAALAAQPSELADIVYDQLSALTDRALAQALARLGGDDVLVSTRPSLHFAAGHFAPESLTLVGWDHMNFPTRYRDGNAHVGDVIDRAMPRLDAYVVLTEADASDYRARHPQARVEVIRNSVAWEIADPRPPHDEKVVAAAGRLTDAKGFERLIDAWALIGAEFPDWVCRIYGTGELRDRLQQRIDAAGVKVELAGYSKDMQAGLREAAVYAMSSRREGFPMTLIEALSQGTPLVAMDCPRGPGEIIVDGSNGRLVPDGDVAGLAEALAELLSDRSLRDRMGEQAVRDARQYAASSIARDWATLIDDLTEGR